MSVIDTLIFDRKNSDIINKTPKAYIDYVDLNRVEQACAYVASLLNVSIQTKTWTMSDFRTDTEMTRLRNNIELLKSSFYAVPGTPELPSKITYTSITQANSIEKILYDIDSMYQSILSGKQRLVFKLGATALGNRR